MSLGKRELGKLHLFTKTLHIALQPNTKKHSNYHLVITEQPSLLMLVY